VPGGEDPAFIAIVGPTASGKTALSLGLARRLEVEIISMDSRQVYRGMDVGTGKATRAQRAQVPHFGLDIREPNQRYSAGQFSRDARRWIREIRKRGRVPLLVGGTGFFLRALTDPMFSEPPMSEARRGKLRAYLDRLPEEDLWAFAVTLDPEREAAVRGGGRQRAIRTIEIALMTGRPLSWWHREGPSSEKPLRGVITVLGLPRDLLYDRINRRVGKMMDEGLVQEVRGLLARGFKPEDPGMTGAGYREVASLLRGEISFDQAVEEVRRAHRRYARRQMTWNRNQLPRGTLPLDGTRPESELVEEVLVAWRERAGEWPSGTGWPSAADAERTGEEET
jgi:tRNA dimethylallyltransferase